MFFFMNCSWALSFFDKHSAQIEILIVDQVVKLLLQMGLMLLGTFS